MTIEQTVPPIGTTSLRTLASRLAGELAGVAADLKAVQETLVFTENEVLSPHGNIALQSLDLAEQTVRALAEIGSALSRLVPDGVVVALEEVLSTCPLSSLVDRLKGVTQAAPVAIDLF